MFLFSSFPLATRNEREHLYWYSLLPDLPLQVETKGNISIVVLFYLVTAINQEQKGNCIQSFPFTWSALANSHENEHPWRCSLFLGFAWQLEIKRKTRTVVPVSKCSDSKLERNGTFLQMFPFLRFTLATKNECYKLYSTALVQHFPLQPVRLPIKNKWHQSIWYPLFQMSLWQSGTEENIYKNVLFFQGYLDEPERMET